MIVNDDVPDTKVTGVDMTNMKRYTLTELVRLVSECGYKIQELYPMFVGCPDNEVNTMIDKLVEMSMSKDKNVYMEYQFVIKIQK